MNKEDILKLGATFIAGGITSYVAFNIVAPKYSGCCLRIPEGRLNREIELDKAKVAHSLDIEDIGDKIAFCRCWRSKKFPKCDGTHNAHNKLTGDNVGPVCLKRNETS